MIWLNFDGKEICSEVFVGQGTEYPCKVCKDGQVLTIFSGDKDPVSKIFCRVGGCRKMFVFNNDGSKTPI